MGIVLGIAAVVLVMALARRGGGVSSTSTLGHSISWEPFSGDFTMTRPLPSFTSKVIGDLSASRDDLVKAALLARGAGYPQLAAALVERSKTTGQLIESLWKDVTSAAWTRFASSIVGDNKPTTINPKGFFGMFQLSVRRLSDLGVMSNPRSKNIQLTNGQVARIWQGDWIVPREKFLTDPGMQYRYFAKSMELYRSIIMEKYKQVIGLDISGGPATLSGLLALAHVAGSEGMYKWLSGKEIRRKFPWVTEAYRKTNGIF